ncbi:MAG: hypothetical protein NPIRA02_16240 [Nitrospirales bacterium]|nr:MAG: hypothetical protein NPIRA02_16240 [Nitrospirales bacterium]
MKKLVTILAVVFASSLLSFFMGEFVLRQIYEFPQPQFLTIDPIVGHRLRPNIEGYYTREGFGFIQINRHGFRDREYQIENNQKKRIAVLGDSFAEALQVNLEETFHELLELEFEEAVEVLNFGVSGYGTAQELLTYINFVRKFKPDIVVLAFYPGNDIADNHKGLSEGYPRPYYSDSQAGLVLDESFQTSSRHLRSKWVYDIYYFLTDHSIVFALLDQLRYNKGFHGASVNKKEEVSGKDGSKDSDIHSDIVYAPKSKVEVTAWLITERLIVELAREVEKDGAEFVLFVLDSMPSQLTKTNNRYYVEDRLGELSQTHALHFTAMASVAIDYYETTGNPLHGFTGGNEGHWNQEGHRIAYQVLRMFLIDNKLIP